jgi:hypothetical protein
MRCLALFFVLLAGCGLSFPSEFRVEDLRILNITLDPPEIPVVEPGFTATTAEQLAQLIITHPNEATVKVSALVAHPDLDATFSYDWHACAPAFGDLPCDPQDRVDLVRMSMQEVEFQPILFLRDQLLDSENPGEAFAELASDPRDLLNGLYARVLLRTTVQETSKPADTGELDGEKRLVIFDPSLVRVTIAEARRLGESGMIPMVAGLDLPSLCTKANDAQVLAIEDFLATRTPNRPPVLSGLTWRPVPPMSEPMSEPMMITGELRMNAGEEIELNGLFGAEREKFRLIDDSCFLVDFEETHVISWFTTQGDLSPRLTVYAKIPEPDRQSSTYTAPPREELTADETRIRIWAVLRDGRGGSAHQFFDVIVER